MSPSSADACAAAEDRDENSDLLPGWVQCWDPRCDAWRMAMARPHFHVEGDEKWLLRTW